MPKIHNINKLKNIVKIYLDSKKRRGKKRTNKKSVKVIHQQPQIIHQPQHIIQPQQQQPPQQIPQPIAGIAAPIQQPVAPPIQTQPQQLTGIHNTPIPLPSGILTQTPSHLLSQIRPKNIIQEINETEEEEQEITPNKGDAHDRELRLRLMESIRDQYPRGIMNQPHTTTPMGISQEQEEQPAAAASPQPQAAASPIKGKSFHKFDKQEEGLTHLFNWYYAGEKTKYNDYMQVGRSYSSGSSGDLFSKIVLTMHNGKNYKKTGTPELIHDFEQYMARTARPPQKPKKPK